VPGDWKDPDGWVERGLGQIAGQDWAVVVLHDITTGCLARLPELLERLGERGVSFEQGFPEGVIATRGGAVVQLEPGYVAEAGHGAVPGV
jgi:hypothetical protein